MANPATAAEPKTVFVLVVEDHTESREAIAEYLTLAGMQVATAEDGLQGVNAARELQPHVIVMDLAMPVLDGWEATRRLKADWSTRHIPIIALSAFGSQPEAGQLALALGCVEMLTKPINPREIEARIRRVAVRHRGDAVAASEN
jgi:two-component system, cell cycle response regulator DivK